MASHPEFVDFIREQLRMVPGISHRKMFGEYALYVGARVVALVCDDRLYLKPTEAGRALLATTREEPPYPGARPYFVLDDHIDDGELLGALFRATAEALPEPKPKRSKRPKRGNPADVIEPEQPSRSSRAGAAEPE